MRMFDVVAYVVAGLCLLAMLPARVTVKTELLAVALLCAVVLVPLVALLRT
jgi:hypothetical protein